MNGNMILLFLALWPMAGALIGYLIGRKSKTARDYFADFVGISEFAVTAVLLWQAFGGAEYSLTVAEICGYGLSFRLDGFRALYGTIAALMWMMTTIFSREYLHHYRNRNRYYLFTLITFGATMGVFLSADLFTTFIFFEIMSFTSYVMVVHDEKAGAMAAGETYVAVAVIGGMVMLMGLFLLYHLTGTLAMESLLEASRGVESRGTLYLAGALILFGFGAKAGMFPLHIWLPKAHPVAPAPASALLSGVLTKAGVFGILVVGSNIFLHDAYWGMAILCIGLVTMFLGAALAVFSIDLKRTLACSSMSQIGFIMVGAGMQGLLGHHNSLAVWGTLLHMVNHSLIKLVLFMAAGVVYMNLHQLDLNAIRGFGRKKPLLKVIFLMGALSIMGVPLWSGYVSKTLLHESIVEFIELLEEGAVAGLGAWTASSMLPFFHVSEWVFLTSGGLTAAYMTKLFVAVFVEKNPYNQEKMDASNGHYMNGQSIFALAVPAVLLLVFGALPNVFMDRIATLGQGFMHGESPAHAIRYFSWTNLKGALISLSIGAAVYLLFIRRVLMRKDENGVTVYVNIWPAWLDLERIIYRPLVGRVIPFFCAFASRVLSETPDYIMSLLHKTLLRKKPVEPAPASDYEPGDMLPHAPRHEMMEEIEGSLSFGLLLFGTGVCAAMIYMLTLLMQ